MNCHGNKRKKQGINKHNPLKHMLHMIICCGLPMIIVALLPAIARVNPSVGVVIGKIVPFLCPVMMIFMIVIMIVGSKKESCCSTKKYDARSKEIV